MFSNANSFKAKIKNISKDKGIPAQQVQQHYLIEQVLKLISTSSYRDSFIVKGGYLIGQMIGLDKRTTMDLDVTLKGTEMSRENLIHIFEEILCYKTDGFSFSVDKLEPIRQDDEYGGFRIAIECKLDNIRQIILLDIATGDPITPKEIVYKYKSTFEDKIYEIYTYNIETILAEKIQTIYQRGVFNTRSKDFYDVYILFHLKKKEIDYEKLGVACRNTFNHRSNKFNVADILNLLDTLKGEKDMLKYWDNYQDRFRYAKNISFHEVIDTITELMVNLIEYD